ncbi:hypothetical protein [Streptomyces venezuelae]|uniref:hypothetical protein n=1 Tax=Streptomyces venezuelae TaxID=54571 RepID=UPI00332AB7B4
MADPAAGGAASVVRRRNQSGALSVLCRVRPVPVRVGAPVAGCLLLGLIVGLGMYAMLRAGAAVLAMMLFAHGGADVTFSMAPAGTVVLVAGGERGFPGVEVTSTGLVPSQTVRVALPSARGLRFVEEGVPSRYQLTVYEPAGRASFYYAEPDPNARPYGLLFRNVDFGLDGQGRVAMWVAVEALPEAPAGDTSLVYDIGGQRSASGVVSVTRP